MAPGERSVQGVVLEEVSVIVALVQTLAAGDQLHWSVDDEGVDQGFEFECARFSGMAMLGLGSVNVDPEQRAGQSSQGGVGNGLVHREMRVRDIVFNVAVGGEECSGAHQNYEVPLEVMRFERPAEQILLVLSNPSDASFDK